MISNAFKGAYQNAVGQQTQTYSTIGEGVKAAGTLLAAALGFSGALGTGAMGKATQHYAAGRIGGIGGNIMLATMNQKKETAKEKEKQKQMFSTQEVGEIVKSQLGDNPINRPALKSLNTVFETLSEVKSQGVIDEEGELNMKQAGNVLSKFSEKNIQEALTKVAEQAKTPEDFEIINNVWDKISKSRAKKKEQDVIVDVIANLNKGDSQK